jgi:hypothetical protein
MPQCDLSFHHTITVSTGPYAITNSRSGWLSGLLAPLPVTQVARVQSPVSAGCNINVEKVALVYNPVSGTRSQAMQLRL